MIIVGLTGGIGHGKTTVAEYLAANTGQHRHWEAADIVTEVANTLRREHPMHPEPDNLAGINSWLTDLADIIATCTHTPADFTQLSLTPDRVKARPENYRKLFEYLRAMQAQPHLQTVEITPDTKRTFRPLLQWLGGYLVKTVNEGIWFDELVRRLRVSATAGLELATVGGVRFPADAERLRNAGGLIIEIKRPAVEDIDTKDITERERSKINVDSRLVNDGTLDQLRRCAAQLYQDIKDRSLKPEYIASTF